MPSRTAVKAADAAPSPRHRRSHGSPSPRQQEHHLELRGVVRNPLVPFSFTLSLSQTCATPRRRSTAGAEPLRRVRCCHRPTTDAEKPCCESARSSCTSPCPPRARPSPIATMPPYSGKPPPRAAVASTTPVTILASRSPGHPIRSKRLRFTGQPSQRRVSATQVPRQR